MKNLYKTTLVALLMIVTGHSSSARHSPSPIDFEANDDSEYNTNYETQVYRSPARGKFNGINVYRASENTCEELQQIVRDEGMVYIKGWVLGLYVSKGTSCPFRFKTNGAYDISSDRWMCFIGLA